MESCNSELTQRQMIISRNGGFRICSVTTPIQLIDLVKGD